jgi:ribose transport system permease protein
MSISHESNETGVRSFADHPTGVAEADALHAAEAAHAEESVHPVRSAGLPLRGDWLRTFSSRYALIGVWIVMAAIYAVWMPSKFLHVATAQAIFGSQSSLLFLSIAALCTFVVGEFDLSFAGVMGLSATIIPVMSGLHHAPILLSCVVAMAAALAGGVINTVFIVGLGVPSLIITLGTSSLFLGIAELISGQNTMSVSSTTFSAIADHDLLGLPLSFYYGLILCVGFAYFLAWTPAGRHVIFVGANREVARLSGINVNRVRATAYLVASVVAGLSGILLVMAVGGFDPTGVQNYLMPALAAVFLGTAIVSPGQFNPMGTFFGIFFLETGILGLQLRGYSGWVQDLFYGAGLVVAVSVAHVVRMRTRTA